MPNIETICFRWIVAILVLVISRVSIYWFIKCSHEKIKKFIDNVDPHEELEIRKKEDDSKRQAELVQLRDKKLIWVTHFMSIMETFMFGVLAVLLFKITDSSDLDKIKYFGIFLGGWLGIKILSNHRPWSNYIAGKAYYHISLIGTFLNIASAVIIAWLIYPSF